MISLELDPNKARHDLTKEETVEDLIPSGKMPDVFEDTTRQSWASLRHLGGGPEYYKIAGRIYYSRTAVEKWLEQNRFIRTDRPVNATQGRRVGSRARWRCSGTRLARWLPGVTAHTPDDNPPVPLTETECWAEVAKAAIDRGLMLEICHDPAHPENPWLRVVPR